MKDVHPIEQGAAGRTLEQRLNAIEHALSLLWDQVWWMSISQERRDEYAKEGYGDPIKRFYVPLKDVHRGN